MAKIIPEDVKNKAKALRKEGKSYGQIMKSLNLTSKGTLSYWLKDFEISPATRKLLKENMDAARERGLFSFNTERTKKIAAENKEIRKSAEKEIGKLSKRELFLIGAALYWGEGFKSERNKNALKICLVNSDPLMIKVFLKFLREILKVKEEKIKAQVRLHPNLNESEAIKFWHKTTGLPLDRFVITRQISKASKMKRPQNSLKFGTIDIRLNDRRLFYKMKGYIDGLAAQIV